MITGFYVRIKRGNLYENLDVAELTDLELAELFATYDAERLKGWACSLVRWIREHAPVSREHEDVG